MAPSRSLRAPARPLAALASVAIVVGLVAAASPATALPGDVEPPVVSILSPVEGQVFTSSAGEVRFTAVDPSGIDSWGLAIDGTSYSSGTGDRAELPIGRLDNGRHTFTLTVTDREGNSYHETRGFEVDRQTVDVWIDSPRTTWVRPGSTVSLTFRAGDYVYEEWSIDGVGSGRAPFATKFKTTSWTVPATWTDGSRHTIEVVGSDERGRSGRASVEVVTDAAAPFVDFTDSGIPAVVTLRTPISGTVSDTASGVSSVRVVVYRADCISPITSATASVSGTSWTAMLPPVPLGEGNYCIAAEATDRAGFVSATTRRPITTDLTAPGVPSGLTPNTVGLEPITELSWSAVAGAVMYEYRAAADSASLATAHPIVTMSTRVPVGRIDAGSVHWQVRALDINGNQSAWSAVAVARAVAAPVLDDCTDLCRLVVGAVPVGWGAVPDAIAYHVRVTGTDADGGPVVVDEEVHGGLLETIVALPAEFPTGTISVRVRAELDVGGSLLTEWSEPQRFLRFSAPTRPTLQSPANGAYVDGDDVALAWTDDPSVVLWELRISSSSTLDADGGLDLGDETAPLLMDPVLLAAFLVSQTGDVPEGVRLDEFDALADCEALLDYLETQAPGSGLVFPCADGSVVLSEPMAQGAYFWQVRGLGFGSLIEGADPGAWSAVGRFTVGEAPAVVAPPGTGPRGGGGALVAPSTDDVAALEEAAERPADDDAVVAPETGAGDAGAGSAVDGSPDDGTPSADAGDSSAGWIVGGIVALFVLAGGAGLVAFLRRR